MALMDHLQEEWNNIGQELYIKLVDSMLKPVQKCLKAKGGHFMIIIVITYFLLLLCFYMNNLIILKTALNFSPLEKNNGNYCYSS